MEEILQRSYFGNTIQDYLITLIIILVGNLVIQLFKRYILKQLKKWAETTDTSVDDYFIKGLERFVLPLFSFLTIYWGLHYLTLSDRISRIVGIALAVIITFYIVRLVSSTIQLVLQSFLRRQPEGEEKVKQLRGIMLIINAVIWILGLLALLDNIGYDVTTIIAGLGIGGIAVALAAQNILGDLFNYFVIFFDRPFEIGDFIIVDNKMGTVEYIGIKTTRLKSLSGEQLVMSNSDLTKSRLHNYKRMERRRIVFSIAVVYDTPMERVQEIPGLLRKAIENQTRTTFDRAHFSSYGESSLNFEVVYFVESPEYNIYMDTHQNINLFILEEFRKRQIEFAYPTRTLYIENGKKMEKFVAKEMS